MKNRCSQLFQADGSVIANASGFSCRFAAVSFGSLSENVYLCGRIVELVNIKKLDYADSMDLSRGSSGHLHIDDSA